MAKKKPTKGKPPAKKSPCPAPKGGKKPVRGAGVNSRQGKATVQSVSNVGIKGTKSIKKKGLKLSAKSKKVEGEKCSDPTVPGASEVHATRTARSKSARNVKKTRTRSPNAPTDLKPATATTKRRRISKPALPDKLWYVIAVESNRDASVKKSVTRKKRIESMQRDIGKCIAPFDYVEEILPLAAEVVAEGREIEASDAKRAGILKAWEVVGGLDGFVDDRREPDGYRVRIHPVKAATKGKVGNGWTWQVKRERTDGERRVLKRILKYPGYLILHMRMTTNAFHLIRDTRGVHYFLPSNDAPISLASEEAARVLIEQQQTVEKHKERNRVIELPFGVGSIVDIKAGVWRNNSGRVTKIDGPPNAPNVSINLTVMGVPVTVNIPHYQVTG